MEQTPSCSGRERTAWTRVAGSQGSMSPADPGRNRPAASRPSTRRNALASDSACRLTQHHLPPHLPFALPTGGVPGRVHDGVVGEEVEHPGVEGGEAGEAQAEVLEEADEDLAGAVARVLLPPPGMADGRQVGPHQSRVHCIQLPTYRNLDAAMWRGANGADPARACVDWAGWW